MPNWSAKVMSWGDVQHDFGDRGDGVKCGERGARAVMLGCCVGDMAARRRDVGHVGSCKAARVLD